MLKALYSTYTESLHDLYWKLIGELTDLLTGRDVLHPITDEPVSSILLNYFKICRSFQKTAKCIQLER